MTVPSDLTNVVAVAAGWDHSLALRADGTVVSWGAGGATNVPSGLTNVVAVSGGYAHSLALLGEGTPFLTTPLVNRAMFVGGTVYFRAAASRLWPVNYQWQHDGTNLPGATNAVLVLANVDAAQAGAYSVMVSNSVGLVATRAAMLAVPPALISAQPQSQVTWVGATVTVSVEAQATAPLSYQWRFNGANLPDATNSVLKLSNVSLAQAGVYSVTLSNLWGVVTSQEADLSVGCVAAWGSCYDSESDSDVPMPIAAGLTDVVAVAAGASHSLALQGDGTVVAWGDNWAGQADVPPDLTNVLAVAAGGDHSLALRADGTVVAWGLNYDQTNVPPDLMNAVAVADGGSHSLALLGDGPPVLSASLSHPVWTADGLSVSLPTQSGRVYALEYKNSLEDANWTLLPLVAGTGHERTLTDPTATGTQRFYRVRRW